MNTCPWCGNTTNHFYLKVKDYFLTQEEFELYQCDHCGLVFTVPRPAPEQIGNYYKSEEYYSHQQNSKGFIPRIYEGVKSINLRGKVAMATSDMVKGRLLDIGCGVGDFLLQVKKLGWEVMGIEPSDQAANIAQSRLGFAPLKPTDYEKLPDQSFDVITMWHVLEHVDDLKSQTKELNRLLRPGGRLVIALPNYQSFDCQYYNDKWAAWDVPRHLNHFSQSCLQDILNTVDFKYLDTQRLIWDAFYISFLSEKYLGHNLPLIRGAWVGLKSNCKALHSGMYSSLVYRYEKQ